MSSIDVPPVPGQSHPHQKLINGLLQLVDWLTHHPQLPIDEYTQPITLHLAVPGHGRASNSQRIAYVREVARLLDVDPAWRNGTQFIAERTFGMGRIEAYAIIDVDHAALMAAAQAQIEAEETVELPAVESAAIEGQAPADVDAVREVDCPDCQGTGRGGEHDGPCAGCLGKGLVLAPLAGEWIAESAGLPPVAERCTVCNGEGAFWSVNLNRAFVCGFCDGTGTRTPTQSGSAW